MTPTSERIDLQWFDRLTMPIAPEWTLRRVRARIAVELMQRHYEAAASGRRTQGWRRTSGDANAAASGSIARLRAVARDLIRNNAYAESAVSTIVDHAVGWGITAAPKKIAGRTENAALVSRWKDWAETTACDAEGRNDLAGLQKQVMRTVVEAGEVLVRRRWRRAEDGLPLPLQLQILEPDYLDTSKDGFTLPGGGQIVQGVEYNGIGQRVAYWMFKEHPGAMVTSRGFGASERIAASEILHVFKSGRPGQVRGVSWFAPVILPMHDFDDYEDAALMKQKIAACLAVITTDVDGSTLPLGTTDASKPTIDSLEPGMILNAAAGRSVSVVNPPVISEHDAYSKTVLRKIATGLGVTYEDLTGDYTDLPFSAARMSRLRHWARVNDWRWRTLIPQFCDPVWAWAMQAASIAHGIASSPAAEWTPPPMPLLDPDKEGLALQRLMRIGAMTWPEMVREQGYDPDRQLAEIKDWNKKFDDASVVLDSDPRKTSQQGQSRDSKAAAASADGATV